MNERPRELPNVNVDNTYNTTSMSSADYQSINKKIRKSDHQTAMRDYVATYQMKDGTRTRVTITAHNKTQAENQAKYGMYAVDATFLSIRKK